MWLIRVVLPELSRPITRILASFFDKPIAFAIILNKPICRKFERYLSNCVKPLVSRVTGTESQAELREVVKYTGRLGSNRVRVAVT